MSLYSELTARGLIDQHTDEDQLIHALESDTVTVYLGFDPTGDSLHVGHLAAIMTLARLQQHGHNIIALVGGGTAQIGDPSGKARDRELLDRETVRTNAEALKAQLQRFITFDDTKKGVMVDNSEWLSDLPLVPFLRDIGSQFRVNEMIKAEGYKERLERESGLSFLEFSYQLMQAYDFLQLYDDRGCTMQIGGSDQWGNISAGVSLIRRLRSDDVHAFTVPLVTTAQGKKMGKTADGTIWLDPNRTSPYELYQYWINVDDRDVPRFLRLCTFLSLEQIDELSRYEGPDIRIAKEKLAFEVTAQVHGNDEAERARDASRALFHGSDAGAEETAPTTEITSEEISRGLPIHELVVRADLADSKSEVRRLIQQGGLFLNEEQIRDHQYIVDQSDLGNGTALLRRGKKRYCRVSVTK